MESIRGVNTKSTIPFIVSSRAWDLIWEKEGKGFDIGSQLSILG
jgi:hypothetical protein